MTRSEFIAVAIEHADKRVPEGETSVDSVHCVIDSFANLFERHLLEDDRKAILTGFLEKRRYSTAFDDAGLTLVPISVVVNEEEHEEWYDDWVSQQDPNLGRYYWQSLTQFLRRELTTKFGGEQKGAEKAARIIRSIDEATERTMDLMANPARNRFDFKGLVLGHVQSGKTANFTALMAKAADSGYQLIIVLAGIHNVLREQTQFRVDKELTGCRDNIETDDRYVEHAADRQWTRLTSYFNEFDANDVERFEKHAASQRPILAVAKKRVPILEKLVNYFESTSEELRAKVPLLIIDDEADQASVNGNANEPESDPTETNKKIRELLGLFQRKTYVGYTATPFANILIDKDNRTDLYPKNFIVSLPEPEGYFGAELLFQNQMAEDFIHEVDGGLDWLHEKEPPRQLEQALHQFLFSCAVRNLRGQADKPMSMLVHVHVRTLKHKAMKKMVKAFMEGMRTVFADEDRSMVASPYFINDWTVYEAECQRLQAGLQQRMEGYTPGMMPSFEEVLEELPKVVQDIDVFELNSKSEDKLKYSERKGVKVIAIGGNQLSRGLTLEGLQVSYYIRESGQYDTTLQMARWFGYRHGYEDLTRVFTTPEIAGNFEHLAGVEYQVRQEISVYEEEGLTPMDLPARILAHEKMKVTSPRKMGAATTLQTSYSGGEQSTFWVPLDSPSILEKNLRSTEAFVKEIQQNLGGFMELPNVKGALLSKNIKGNDVLRFLEDYEFASPEQTDGRGIDKTSMMAYIKRRLHDGELNDWSVALAGPEKAKKVKGEAAVHDFGHVQVNKVWRSRLHRYNGPGAYNIGSLTDKKHRMLDYPSETDRAERRPSNPLLLIYVVDKRSEAKKPKEGRTSPRVDLFKGIPENDHRDVIGLGFVFPTSRGEKYNYVGQP